MSLNFTSPFPLCLPKPLTPKRSSKSSSDDDADADGDDDEDYQDNKASKRKRANRTAAVTTKGEIVAANRLPRSFPLLTSPMSGPYRVVKDTPEYNHSENGSDSDYGAPSRKKKRTAAPNEDFRFSSRGNRVPNYAENDEDEDASGDDDDMMDIDGVAHISAGPEEEVHEIEGVFDHHRDEERKKDPQDDFYSNIVRQSRPDRLVPLLTLLSTPALPRQVERLLSPSQYRRDVCFPQEL